MAAVCWNCCSLSRLCPWSCPLCSDVSANSTAAYVTGMVRGATTGLVIDLGEQTHGKGREGAWAREGSV